MAKKKKAKPVAKKPSGKKSAGKKKPAAKVKKSPAKAKVISLGRPKVTVEEKLFLLFKEDYHARQIFEFLRAETVRDLETWSPEEIVRKLSQPIRQSVERIRLKLAQNNRCLRDDQEYAAEHGDDVESG